MSKGKKEKAAPAPKATIPEATPAVKALASKFGDITEQIGALEEKINTLLAERSAVAQSIKDEITGGDPEKSATFVMGGQHFVVTSRRLKDGSGSTCYIRNAPGR